MPPSRRPAGIWGSCSGAYCGNSNARIDTILKRFRQPLPVYVSDVSPRVRDLMVAKAFSVPETATCAEALELIDKRRRAYSAGRRRHQSRVVGTISLPQLGGRFLSPGPASHAS